MTLNTENLRGGAGSLYSFHLHNVGCLVRRSVMEALHIASILYVLKTR